MTENDAIANNYLTLAHRRHVNKGEQVESEKFEQKPSATDPSAALTELSGSITALATAMSELENRKRIEILLPEGFTLEREDREGRLPIGNAELVFAESVTPEVSKRESEGTSKTQGSKSAAQHLEVDTGESHGLKPYVPGSHASAITSESATKPRDSDSVDHLATNGSGQEGEPSGDILANSFNARRFKAVAALAAAGAAIALVFIAVVIVVGSALGVI